MGFTKEDTKAVKGIAICLMLYHHLFAFPERIMEGSGFVSLAYFGGTALSTYIGQFGRICVPVYLFLSGYGLYLLPLENDDVKKLVLERIWGFYKTVWKVFILSLPVSAFIFRYERSLLIKDVIYNFLGLSCSFNAEWWFIVPFAMLLILFPALRRFLERERANVFSDILILLAYSAFYNYIVPQIMTLPVLENMHASVFWYKTNEMLSILPAFALGCIFAKYGILDAIKRKYAGKLCPCILALICMAALVYIRLYNNKYYDFINGAVFVSCLAVLMPLRIMKWPNALFKKLGAESTNMWLTHTFFCTYWCQRLIYAPQYSFLVFLLLLAVSYCASKFIRLFWKATDRLFNKKTVVQVS